MKEYSSDTNSYLTDVDTCSINRHSHCIARYYQIGIISSAKCDYANTGYITDYDKVKGKLHKCKVNAFTESKSIDIARYYLIVKSYINTNDYSILDKVANSISTLMVCIDKIANKVTKYYQISKDLNKGVVYNNKVSIV